MRNDYFEMATQLKAKNQLMSMEDIASPQAYDTVPPRSSEPEISPRRLWKASSKKIESKERG